MTKDEALKLALEALDGLIKKTSGQSIYSFMETERRIAMSACVGIREALARPAQEPVACIGTNGELMWLNKPRAIYSKPIPLYTTPPQPAQEPVAWLYIEPENPYLNVHYDDVDVSQFPYDEWFPVYKSKPQRTWVGLTDEEIDTTWKKWIGTERANKSYTKAIEAKLKEKNT